MEKRKADRGRIPADLVTAVTDKMTGQSKKGTWGTHVVDFVDVLTSRLDGERWGGLDQCR